MATKYMLMRKIGKGVWKAIWMEDDGGIIRNNGKCTSKAKAEAARAKAKDQCPEEKYAVIEVVTED